ncbi:transcriptional regulator [Nonomuraea phyllanthi]|nr:transcriptional regulator [Nonomuraea phyllanthi]
MSSRSVRFAVALAALCAAHEVGDQWMQTHHQALTKGGRGEQQRAGQAACARHVVTMTATKALMLGVTSVATRTRLPLGRTALALGVDAASHYWADRRFTLAGLADRLGKGEYYRLGAPREGRDDNVTIGTGAYALDQAWHAAWLWVAALIVASGEEVM